MVACGVGGQPGMYTSMGTILSLPPHTQYMSWKMPPLHPHAP